MESFKSLLQGVVGNVKPMFKELTTVLTQIVACINSQSLVTLLADNRTEALTPGHFVIG